MADNLKGIPFSSPDEGDDKVERAKLAVVRAYNEGAGIIPEAGDIPLTVDMVYVVKFGYILGHWKGFLSTTIADGMYYEVTYNSIKKETYVDGYMKVVNAIIPD